jgi:hypothetical protein
MRPNDRNRWYDLYRQGLDADDVPSWLRAYTLEDVMLVLAHDLRHQVSYIISWAYLWVEEVNWEAQEDAQSIRDTLHKLHVEADTCNAIITEGQDYFDDTRDPDELTAALDAMSIFQELWGYTPTLKALNEKLRTHPALESVTLNTGDDALTLHLVIDTVDQNTAMLERILAAVDAYSTWLG